MRTRGKITLARSGCKHINLVQDNQGSMCVGIAARRLVMIRRSHHVAMLGRPRKTACQRHNHYKWLHEQKRLWPIEVKMIDIASSLSSGVRGPGETGET